MLILNDKFLPIIKFIISRDEKMKSKSKQNILRVGEVFPQTLNFFIVFTTFAFELSSVVEGFVKKELTVSSPSFILYIGTLVSLFMSELVYEPSGNNHSKLHSMILWLSAIGGLISLFGSLFCSGTVWENNQNLKFWIFHIIRCIVISTYAILCGPCLYKAIVLWKENKEDSEVDINLNEGLSDLDVDCHNTRKEDQ